MIVYPTIELLNGRCVSLFNGHLDEPQIWHVDPLEKAKEFANAGAGWIQVTDFDAVASQGNNNEILEGMIRSTNASIQLGGGFRTYDTIAEWIDKGAGRIVVSTVAITQPDVVKQACKFFPDQIVLAVDVADGYVVGKGWREASQFTPEAFVDRYVEDPLAAIVVTDVTAKFNPREDSFALATRLADYANAPVIARGMVRDLDDLARIKYLPHISGAIINRALFDRSIELSDAIALAAQSTGPMAKLQ